MTRAIPVIAVTVAEAAEAVGVSPSIIYAKVRSGELPATRIGKERGTGDLRIWVRDLERLFEKPEAGQ